MVSWPAKRAKSKPCSDGPLPMTTRGCPRPRRADGNRAATRRRLLRPRPRRLRRAVLFRREPHRHLRPSGGRARPDQLRGIGAAARAGASADKAPVFVGSVSVELTGPCLPTPRVQAGMPGGSVGARAQTTARAKPSRAGPRGRPRRGWADGAAGRRLAHHAVRVDAQAGRRGARHPPPSVSGSAGSLVMGVLVMSPWRPCVPGGGRGIAGSPRRWSPAACPRRG